MSRWHFPAFAVLFAGPALAAPPTAEEARTAVRKAAGFEAFHKLPEGIVYEGKAEFLGIPGTFRMRLAPDGRYVRVIDAKGEQAVGFDGTTRWGRNFSGPVRVLELEEGDRDRYLFGVLCQRWLADGGGFEVAVDAKATTDARVWLTLSHHDAGVTARLALDRATWLPERLEMPGTTGTRVIEFSEYRQAEGAAFPARVVIAPVAGGQWVSGERGGVYRPGDKNPFSPPVAMGGAKFDARVKVESKRMAGGLLLVRPAVNGKPVPWFILDTGNGALTSLTAAVADRLDLPAFGGTTAAGAAQVKTRFRQAKSFTLGPATVADPVLIEFPQDFADAVSRSAGVEVAGQVGWDFLFQAVVEVEHRAATVAVHDPVGYRLAAGAAWEPVRFNARMPCVKGRFEGKHEGLFMFDTGHEAKLTLHAPAVARLDLLKGRETTPQVAVGIGGKVVVRGGGATEFQVLGRTLKPLDACFATEADSLNGDPYTLGTFGLSALGSGTVVFDYPNRRIAFVPKP